MVFVRSLPVGLGIRDTRHGMLNRRGPSAVAGPVLVACMVLAGLAIAGCTTAAAPPPHLRLLVSPLVSLFDVPIDIQVTGLNPGDKVTLQLESSDRQWSARATFDAQQSAIDLDSVAPASGSYQGVHGMGLFEALALRQPSAFLPDDPGPVVFILTASAPGSRTVTVRLTRELTGPGVTCGRLSVAGNGFYGLYCAPAPHSGRRVPVLVFGGSEGGLSTAATAELLASRGFPALALAYFGEPGLPGAERGTGQAARHRTGAEPSLAKL